MRELLNPVWLRGRKALVDDYVREGRPLYATPARTLAQPRKGADKHLRPQARLHDAYIVHVTFRT